jgi:hypothetical protein
LLFYTQLQSNTNLLEINTGFFKMAELNKKHPGGHYSGKNPVPNIQRFVESLDGDKKERDRKINEQVEHQNANEAVDHINRQKAGVPGSRKQVTDPVTGRDVTIEDVNKDFMKAVDNPQVRALCFPLLLS